MGVGQQKNMLDWSPGLSKELSPTRAVAEKVKIPSKVIEPESYRSSEDASISTQFDEAPLSRDPSETRKYIKEICETLWPEVQACFESGSYDSLKAPSIFDPDDVDHYFLNNYK